MLIFKQLCFLLSLISASIFAQQPTEKFSQLNDFGSNPGELSASYFTSTKASKRLVVLLHGCSQNGEQLAQQSGFVELAKKHQFNLLIPQQSKSNNIQSCFNWFSPQDQQRNQGETLSLKQMIDTLKTRTQATQVYIVGLSAGGAMASAMLVNYPNLFNAGAIISGIAYPCADNLTKAISCMRNGPSQTIEQLVQQSLTQNTEQKTWPRLSVWTGDKDKVVAPINAHLIAQYWVSLSGVTTKPKQFQHDGYQHKHWQNSQGESIVELFQVTDMGHGIAIKDSNEQVETPYLLKAPLSAANEIVNFWF